MWTRSISSWDVTLYGRGRRFVKTFSGRRRYNVLGALGSISKEVTMVASDPCIAAGEVCELFRKTAASYAGKAVFIVPDNARYQKCGVTGALAAGLGIKVVFILPYSPNFNLMERLWKFEKGKLSLRYYNRYELFWGQIGLIIDAVPKLQLLEQLP
ncbi:MAG: transposase [Treponema sp.]|jgi:transposase|nr:transposase [Treponema sp.]